MIRDDLYGPLGLVAVAAAQHAGVLVVAGGLGVSPGALARPTRLRLLQVCVHVVERASPGLAFQALWAAAGSLAALALLTALDILGEGA